MNVPFQSTRSSISDIQSNLLLLPETNRKISKEHTISGTIVYNQDYCFNIYPNKNVFHFHGCFLQIKKKKRKDNRLNYILFHAQQNLCIHHLITTFTLPLAMQNTKLILQQTIRKVCFAQLIPNIQLEINQASTLLRGNVVWSWSQLQSCRENILLTDLLKAPFLLSNNDWRPLF